MTLLLLLHLKLSFSGGSFLSEKYPLISFFSKSQCLVNFPTICVKKFFSLLFKNDKTK